MLASAAGLHRPLQVCAYLIHRQKSVKDLVERERAGVVVAGIGNAAEKLDGDESRDEGHQQEEEDHVRESHDGAEYAELFMITLECRSV